jgi:hypothetical protein
VSHFLRSLLCAFLAAGLLLAGCGKPAKKSDDLAVSRDRSEDEGAKGDKGADEAANAEVQATPCPDLLWKGDGTSPLPDSFGPAGPSPILLLGGAIAKGAAVLSGDETRGTIEVKGDAHLTFQYERDDDIDSRWVRLPKPKGGPDTVQYFAGMAVWTEPAEDGTGAYEAESAIYLVKGALADVLPEYEEAFGAKWEEQKVSTGSNPAVTEVRTWLVEEGSLVRELTLAAVAGGGVTQVTIARVASGDEAVVAGLVALCAEGSEGAGAGAEKAEAEAGKAPAAKPLEAGAARGLAPAKTDSGTAREPGPAKADPGAAQAEEGATEDGTITRSEPLPKEPAM